MALLGKMNINGSVYINGIAVFKWEQEHGDLVTDVRSDAWAIVYGAGT
jgi:hypothetical protein